MEPRIDDLMATMMAERPSANPGAEVHTRRRAGAPA
jgi:hypothetical protein